MPTGAMATVAPAALQRRKKQTVYGKAVRKAYSINHDFLEDDEPVAAPAAKRVKPTSTIAPQPVKAAKVRIDTVAEPVAKPASPTRKPGALPKVAKTPAKLADPYDIPSSDDESAHTVEYVPAPLKLHSRSQLVNEPTETGQLAPWERRAARAKDTVSGNTTGADSGPEKQLNRELAEVAISKGVGSKSASTSLNGSSARQGSDAATSNNKTDALTAKSALDRLAARKLATRTSSQTTSNGLSQTSAPPAKRATPEVDVQQLPTGKRRRVAATEKRATGNTDFTITYQERQPRSKEVPAAREADVFDVPVDEDKKMSSSSPPAMRISPKHGKKQRSRLPARSSRLGSPKTSVSAPERLTEMLPPDEDAYPPMHESQGEGSNPSTTPLRAARVNSRTTPARSSSTPRSTRSATPQTTGALTPKQTQLWADFFDPAGGSDPPTPVAGLKKLSIDEKKLSAGSEVKPPKLVTKDRSDATRRRTRAVDRLKALAVSSSEDDSSEDEGGDGDEDQKMGDAENSPVKSAPQTLTRQDSGNRFSQNTQTSQSQEKPQAATEGGHRITYAKARSHLAEESLDNMILDLPMDTPQRPAATARRVGKPAGVSRKSAFDIEESDEDVPRGVRTIHDLRAAGRNTRVMGEIGDLLQEIADHSTAARSRRRSALLELATKLFDKAFAEQFLAHGFEYQLIAECSAPPNPVTDFILTTAFALLLSIELSVHTTRSFEPVLSWLAGSFSESTDIIKLAKERRSNMSKAAQSDVAAFAQKFKSSPHLWTPSIPLALSPRLMALKATDSLVGKLRGVGDKSELLSNDAIAHLVPQEGLFIALDGDADKATQAGIVVSILEALSTLSAVGSWPAPVIQAVASLPAVFAQDWQAPPHTKWLAYRLCLNLTNDPAINQRLFTDSVAVRHLLSDIVAGFENLHQSAPQDDEDNSSALHLDLLVLAIGILTNLAEHSTLARSQAIDPLSLPALRSIVGTFRTGQDRLLDAASEEESAANVAFGYLAVMLANICQDAEARAVVKGMLPKGRLDVLVEAVEEFVRHHRKVDEVGFEGAEGREVWGRFTERLVGVLERLKRDVDG